LLQSLNEQPAEAARCYQQACDLQEALVAAHPKVPRYPAALVIGLNELSKQLTKLGQLPQAGAASRRALELAKKLVQDFPEVPANQELLAQVHARLGQGYGHAVQLADREEARRQALAGYEKLAQAYPTVPRYRTECCRAQWAVGNLLWDTGRRAEAVEAYHLAAALAANLNPEGPQNQELLALFLATCPHPQFRDARRAVELAQKVVDRNPQRGVSWNTLGVARYRAGDWGAAVAALEKSLALCKGGDCGDWFFLAMAHWQRGEQDQARRWYDQAAQWMEQHTPRHEEWRHFRTETEELLGRKSGL
jgi:tetratricopeptide (TPR) repeat protein